MNHSLFPWWAFGLINMKETLPEKKNKTLVSNKAGSVFLPYSMAYTHTKSYRTQPAYVMLVLHTTLKVWPLGEDFLASFLLAFWTHNICRQLQSLCRSPLSKALLLEMNILVLSTYSFQLKTSPHRFQFCFSDSRASFLNFLKCKSGLPTQVTLKILIRPNSNLML